MTENNAHVRATTLARHSAEVLSEDARRLLNDPTTARIFDQMEREIVDQIAVAPDGSRESEEVERELCRTLRTIRRLRGGMSTIVQMQTLRAAVANPPEAEPEREPLTNFGFTKEPRK